MGGKRYFLSSKIVLIEKKKNRSDEYGIQGMYTK